MLGDFAEAMGGIVGEYVGAVYGQYILAFLIPLIVSAPFIWAAEKFVSPMPEPDYRQPLLALLATQILLVLVGHIALFGLSAGLASALPAVAVLGLAAAWLFARPGTGPLLLIGACEIYGLFNLISALLAPSIPGAVIANILGTLILVAGALLWVVVGLRFRHARSASPA